MEDDTALRVENAKVVVNDVLAGRITPETCPPAFLDDVVYISVRIVEQRAPAWLLDQIAAARGGNVSLVIDCMAAPPRTAANGRHSVEEGRKD